jgi:pyruvate kinase
MKKRTKIVATIGPSTSSPNILKSMIKEGVNVFRINFSHGTHQDHIDAIKTIKQVDEELGTHSALLADLQGPKIRIGEMPDEGLVLEDNQDFYLTTLKSSLKKPSAYISLEQIPKDVKKGEKILLDDGKIHLIVEETNKKDTVKTKVLAGGVLYSRKGVNLPDTKISVSSLTNKDKEDLKVALDQEVDWVGFSFVRSAREVIELKHLISNHNGNAKVIAKIEKPEAVNDLNAIMKETDAVMVARGDLGVEVPLEKVPLIQKKIVEMAQSMAKPVIIATQMMESMMDNITPNRAEVNDVANAVMDGADAVMLSGETSVGKHPVEVIKIMSRIINEVEENYKNLYLRETLPNKDHNRFITDSICFNVCRLAQRIEAKAIVTMTHSGYTAYKISSQRPKSNIYVFSSNKKLLSTLSLVWGVATFYYNKTISTDHTIADIKHFLKGKKLVSNKDLIINTASIPLGESGNTNMLKLSYVD